jgi:ferredoxin
MGSQGLTVKLDDNVFDVDGGDNLLSSLISKGADVRYGCRAGACGACRLYDLGNCESILSCQTAISSSMALSTQTPATSVEFSILALNLLDESNVEVTLLGPSDDSFGDRVFVSVLLGGLLEKGDHFVECMALNQAGAPLKIILQQGAFSKTEWQRIAELSVNDFLRVQVQSGVRKGRLLYEMGLSDSAVLLVCSFENAVFESYWRDVLQEFSNHRIECFMLSSYRKSSPESMNNLLQDELFISFLNNAVVESGGSALHIIYHGQNLPKKDWEQALRPLRLRTNQLHFVR